MQYVHNALVVLLHSTLHILTIIHVYLH